jgi:uncharacterized protein (TIGR02996 family)
MWNGKPEDDTVRLVYADWLDENGGNGKVIRDGVKYRGHTHEFEYRVGAQGIGFCWKSSYGMETVGAFQSEALPALDRFPDAPTGTVAVVNRGMVCGLRCTQTFLLGGPCWGCDGVGDDAGRLEQSTVCPTCGGSGDKPGAIADLFNRYPITWVELTDKIPDPHGALPGWILSGFGRGDMRGEPHEYEDDRDCIAAELWHLLEGGGDETMTSTGMNVDALWRPYATADAANAALNKAAVKLGREKAKLFPL